MKLFKSFLAFFLMLAPLLFAFGQEQRQRVVYQNEPTFQRIDQNIYLFEDPSNQLEIDEIVNQSFTKLEQTIPSLGFSESTLWLRFDLENHSIDSNLLMMIQQPTLDLVCLYQKTEKGFQEVQCQGEFFPFHQRPFNSPRYIFSLNIPSGSYGELYLKIKCIDQIQVPIVIGNEQSIMESDADNGLIFGIYIGIVIIMMLYNLFIAFTVRDSVYLYYILYILFVGMTQAMFQGYAFKFLWPDSPWIAIHSSVIVPFLSGITTIFFIRKFLQVDVYAPKHLKGLQILLGLYTICLVLGLSGIYFISIQLMQMTASIGSLYVLYVAFIIRRQGYRPASFFLVAFSIFLLSVVIFVLRNFNIVPYNDFTSYILEIGSVFQISLLSFALADKINFFRNENEKLIREQNIVLEQKVEERTNELLNLNEDLESTLSDLKEAQSQLVESEKMASLGQLTAGIAHEINNPINFVTANVTPLRRDFGIMKETLAYIEEVSTNDEWTAEQKQQKIEAYKEDIDFDYLNTEIEFLLKGMYEGASRTAEIVKSLRIFSRVDEDSSKFADINEGLESTLVILNSILKESVQVVKEYGDIPPIECYPGKLNQAFLNIISNSLFAIQAKFGDQPGGRLTIKTVLLENQLAIHIGDNGIGMSDAIKKKIFEPFFTTKEVGEGTGLGMSIVYNTIKKHSGEIEVETQEGEGTTFILKVPIKQT
jgi:two-component system NtrC family sensor kinase